MKKRNLVTVPERQSQSLILQHVWFAGAPGLAQLTPSDGKNDLQLIEVRFSNVT